MIKELKVGSVVVIAILSGAFLYSKLKPNTSAKEEAPLNISPPKIVTDKPATNQIKKDLEYISRKYAFNKPDAKIPESCVLLGGFTLHQLEYDLASLEEAETGCHGKGSNTLKSLAISCQTTPYTQDCLLGVSKYQAQSMHKALSKVIENFGKLDPQDKFRVFSAEATLSALNGNFDGTQAIAMSMLDLYPEDPNVQNFVIVSSLVDSKSDLNMNLIKDMVNKSTDNLGSKPLMTYIALINSQKDMDPEEKDKHFNWLMENYPESEVVEYINFIKNMETKNYQNAKKSLELGLVKNPNNNDFSNNLIILNKCIAQQNCKGTYFSIESLGQIPRIDEY